MPERGRSPYVDLDRPPLREAALVRGLTRPPSPWLAVRVLAETTSTNAVVAAAARVGEPAGLVVVAERQTAGRGRLDRTWTGPARAGLTLSVLLRPVGVPVARWTWLPLLAGVALVDGVTRVAELPADVRVGLKWPNDLLVDDGSAQRKLGGVLVEVVDAPAGAAGARAGEPAAVVGIGLNVTTRADELPHPGASSLALAGAEVTDRDSLLRALLRALADRYAAWTAAAGDPAASGLAATYRDVCTTLSRVVRADLPGGRSLHGEARAVDDDGRLVVVDADGRAWPLGAGDVTHLRPA